MHECHFTVGVCIDQSKGDHLYIGQAYVYLTGIWGHDEKREDDVVTMDTEYLSIIDGSNECILSSRRGKAQYVRVVMEI